MTSLSQSPQTSSPGAPMSPQIISLCPEGNYVLLVYPTSPTPTVLYLRTGDFYRVNSRDQLQDLPLIQSLAVKKS